MLAVAEQNIFSPSRNIITRAVSVLMMYNRCIMAQVDFSKGNLTSNIMRTALPMLVAQVLSLLYNIVDRIYIGRIPEIGTAALGAVGICFPVITIITAFTNLFGSGGSPLFAIELGRGDTDEARRFLKVSFFLLTVSSVVLMVFFLVFSRSVLVLFGASDSALIYALPYMRIYLIGTFFAMTGTGLNPFITAQGFPRIGMATVIIGAAANIILDPIFIFGLGLGVEGAAIATVISQVLSSLFAIGFLKSRRAPIRLERMRPGEIKENTSQMMNITSLGTASFVMSVTNSLVTICCNNVLAHTGGDIYVSVMTIVNSVRQVLDVPNLALSDGTSPVISYNYGAKKYGNVKKSIRLLTAMILIYTIVIWILIMVSPSLFINIFTNDAEVRSLAIPALRMYFFMFVCQALQISGQTAFKSLNKKKQAIFFSLFRKVIIVVPLTYLLPYAFGMGTSGVFIAEPVSNLVGGVFCYITMYRTVVKRLPSTDGNDNQLKL